MGARFSDRLKTLLGIGATDAFFDDLEDLLIEGDVGARAALAAVDTLKGVCRREGLRT